MQLQKNNEVACKINSSELMGLTDNFSILFIYFWKQGLVYLDSSLHFDVLKKVKCLCIFLQFLLVKS